MKQCSTIMAFLLASGFSTLKAELLFHENFDVPPGTEILGNENGWQADFNAEGPSEVKFQVRNVHEASPFPKAGQVVQLAKSSETMHRKIDSLNGKAVYFSYSMKPFRDDGLATLRFRDVEGGIIMVGMIGGKFASQIMSQEVVADKEMHARQAYFIVGRLELSENGAVVNLVANDYTHSMDVPAQAPETWHISNQASLGRGREWNGVEFRVASSNAAFDDLRIGTTWESVTRP